MNLPATKKKNNRSFRGLLQSEDGVISQVIKSDKKSIIFKTAFGLSDHMLQRLKNQPEHIIFSERSRIARLGIQITCEAVSSGSLSQGTLTLTQTATQVIPGYPELSNFRELFDEGLPVGRLVFCDPDALLSSGEVMEAIAKSELKLPASTAIASDGSIIIAPHKVEFGLRQEIDKDTLARILLRKDGRELLNWHQVPKTVPAVTIGPGQGVITTCSMYLNEHYVVLQSGSALGSNLPATVLDPIKTRGIHIYLEIVNNTGHPILTPLITARIYGAPRRIAEERRKGKKETFPEHTYKEMMDFGKKLDVRPETACHHITKPVAMIEDIKDGLEKAEVVTNGPEKPCRISRAGCSAVRREFSPRPECEHVYATTKIINDPQKKSGTLAMKFFPNIMEHRDIINMACDRRLDTLYFFEPSYEHGPFLSQQDHQRLLEYHSFGIEVYWVCGLNKRLMVHTMRDSMGYFVLPERLADFHKSMLFAFYGSTLELSEEGKKRLGDLMDALVGFWGKNIGIVTGGGSGVMETANTMARRRGILSGANFLNITDQSLTTDVDFCQVFQSTCRHSRQKWFEIASFPIFNVGGLGSLEELGITLCNMKLSIMERVPIILFDTEGYSGFWDNMKTQLETMVKYGRAPTWILENLVITDDPEVIIDSYRKHLQLF